MTSKDVKDILKKHGARIEEQIKETNFDKTNYSREYVQFKEEMSPEFSRYEKLCNSLGNFIRLKVADKDKKKIERDLEIAHLGVEAGQALTLSIMAFLGVLFFGLLLSIAFTLLSEDGNFPYLFFFLMVILSIFSFYFIQGYPSRLAAKWRLKASSQMVPAILYVVIYMRHTPNLEKAISFASQHLQYPLSLDFKKIFYDVSIGKFSTIKESLDNYLTIWEDYSTEFIEAFHLIESSLYEPDNSRRISTLEKALEVILDGVYDKMLKFSHNVRSPLTNIYMLGVVLPTLGLALLPLVSAMIGEYIKWIHVFILFNLIIPFLVFYLTDKILLLRPGGYGEASLLERNRLYPQYKSNKYYLTAFLICLPFFILGSLPLIFQYTAIPEMLDLQRDYTFSEIGWSFFGDEKIFDFKQSDSGITGPFGIGALFLSMFFPLGFALFFSLVYKSKTHDLMVEREKTHQLESEFNNSLFLLGNRIGDGLPPELVFGRVANSSKGLITEDFFRKVNYNIQQMGMGVEKAIFDPRNGVLVDYPSDLIATSMRVLVESAKKGLKIAAISLMSISTYVKNIQKINYRLRDLLAEIVSDMKSNMTFLAPLLSGIVVGLAAMITGILNKLDLNELSAGSGGVMNFATILTIFDLTNMIPPYYLQISIGIYLIQIIFILTGTLVTVDSGEDKLEKTNKTGINLKKGVFLYLIAAFFSTLALSFLTIVVMNNLV